MNILVKVYDKRYLEAFKVFDSDKAYKAWLSSAKADIADHETAVEIYYGDNDFILIESYAELVSWITTKPITGTEADFLIENFGEEYGDVCIFNLGEEYYQEDCYND